MSLESKEIEQEILRLTDNYRRDYLSAEEYDNMTPEQESEYFDRDGNSIKPKFDNVYNLLDEILYCLNQLKNQKVGSNWFKDTYEICTEISKHKNYGNNK
jgi:hypothetical protein